MSEEKELQEPDFGEDNSLDGLADFVDLTDLGELDTASNLEVFGELGDIADLGDIPDLSEMESAASETSGGDIPLPDVSEDTLATEVPLPDVAAETMTSDAPLPDMNEEIAIRTVEPEPDAPDIFSDSAEKEDLFQSDGGTEESETGLPADFTLEDTASDTQPLPDLPDDVILDEALAGIMDDAGGDSLPDLEDVAAGIPDIDEADVLGTAPDLDGGSGEDVLAALDFGEDSGADTAMEDVLGALDDSSAADIPPIDALDDSGTADMPSIDALDDSGAADMPSIDALDDSGAADIPSIDAPEENGAPDMLSLDALEDNGESDIDSMLGGLLDNLDMNGAIEEPAATEAMSAEEADEMADILGLGDNPFGADEMEETGDIEDMLDVAGMIPDAPEAEEKKPGMLKKVFGNVITDEIAEKERMEAQKAEEEAAKKAEEEARAKEEAEAAKAEKKAAREAAKAEKKKEKEAKKAEKAAKKAEKKAQREEEEAAELEVVGKLNKVGVSIVVVATVLFLAVEIAGTNIFSYASAKKEAMNYFEMGKYTEAYQEAIGTDMKDKDAESYNKIKVVMKVQQSLNAYQNYDRINYYPEALDALLRGIKRYDANIEEGIELEADKDMMSCRKQILTLLKEEFNLSETEAYSIIALDKEEYQNRVIEIGLKKK